MVFIIFTILYYSTARAYFQVYIQQKIPLTKQEVSASYLMRGIISLYSLFHADRHTGLKPELQIVIIHIHFFK